MKTNKYANLVKFGLSQRTLMTLSESEIDKLHKNLVEGKKETKEQVTQTTKQVKTTKIPASAAKTTGAVVDGVSIKQDSSGNIYATQNEGEMTENKKKKSKKEFEPNPWAICHSQLGPKKTPKFERCVQAIKKSMNENKLPFDVILENKILSLVEKHIKPRMKKGDLINMVEEKKMSLPIGKIMSMGKVSEDTKEAPVKTPVKTPSKPDKDSPYKPKTSPAPKAKKETKEQTAPSKPAPTTKPGTKTPPKPDKISPYKPKTSPAPKAKKSMPSWMSFDSLGIKFKK